MRLGAQMAELVSGTKAAKIYGKDVIIERHRHRYEVNTIIATLRRIWFKVSVLIQKMVIWLK